MVSSRRGFLRYALAGAVATPFVQHADAHLSTSKTRPQSSMQKHDILVLGAGMSGLTAALSLHRAGHRVKVIEYQNRVGGRLLSIPLKGGQYSEAGGGHFRSNMPYTLAYIKHFKLPLLSMNDGLPRYLYDNKTADSASLLNWPFDLHENERNVTVSSLLNYYLYLNGLDTDSVLSADWPDAETKVRLDGLTVGDMLRRVGASEAFLMLLDAHGGTFTSQSAALGVIPDLAYHFGDQNLFRIKGGNDLLPQAMSRELGDRVILNSPVVSINQTQKSIHITVEDGRSWSADYVISTIPFTILKDIEVTPSWTSNKRRMFNEMVWDKSVKVIVQTQSPKWLEQNVHGWPLAGSDKAWERVIDITGNETGSYGNVFFYINGSNSDRYLSRPKAARANEIVNLFNQDMPGLFDEIVTLKEFAWSEQPWIRGSFGSPPLGGGWMISECEQPEGRIYFAGDFTTFKSGWVEGAIESGLRAARQIDPNARAESTQFLRQEMALC